jgi:protein lifeguard
MNKVNDPNINDEEYRHHHNGNPSKNYNYTGEKLIYPGGEASDIESNIVMETYTSQIRMGFIRKVYGILSAQLLITVGFVGLGFLPEVNKFMYQNIGLFYGAMFLNLMIILSMVCVPSLFRSVPTNYILLFIWTICEGYMVATVTSFNPPEIVLMAAALTAAVSVGLTVYAWTTKTDFTFLGGFLFVLTFVMFMWGILILIFGYFLYTLYCLFGVLLFSIYLIFDTQLILGRFGMQYEIDDYILAALNIYIDIIQLFLFILSLLRRENN